MSVNKVILLGYVGQDPELSYPEKDRAIARFSLATNERQGTSGVETTEWHRLICFDRNASFAERYVRKGTRLYVEGKIKYREYEDKFHVSRRIAEIHVERFEILGRKE
ncbi:MAG: single-stranded DNA-binding protein [Muribaculaceae bacterium]|nr:single-stranded DNA-binding protein [Muribaculaceae bacterium]